MHRVIADRSPIASDDQHSRNLPQRKRLKRQIQTLSDDVDGYGHAVSIRFAQHYLSLVFKLFCAHDFETSDVAELASGLQAPQGYWGLAGFTLRPGGLRPSLAVWTEPLCALGRAL